MKFRFYITLSKYARYLVRRALKTYDVYYGRKYRIELDGTTAFISINGDPYARIINGGRIIK